MQNADMLKKISISVLSPTILHRETLVEKLLEILSMEPSAGVQRLSRYKLVMVCAPAGYGKTTFLTDFSHYTNFPCCWYFLDETDIDKTTFLRYLILSIQYRFPTFGQKLELLLSNAINADIHHPAHARHLETIIDALVMAISSEISERFILFLCNYHEVNSSQIVNNLVNQLLQKLPSNCTIVIESRAVPALDVASLLSRDEIAGFDRTLLQFTPKDILDLTRLQGVAPLKMKEAEQLASLFEGWIAGILLGTHLGNVHVLRSHHDMYTPSNGPDMQIDRQSLFAYLVHEVFSRDQEMYTFLQSTAVLQQLKPILCNALLEITDAADRLYHLEQQGFFVTHIGEGSELTYRCQPVLCELLCDELQRQSPEYFILLHQRAMEGWLAIGNYEQAIYHAFKAALDDRAAQLILLIHKQIFAEGRVETLAHWIDALDSETVERYPRLLLVRAEIYLLLSEHAYADTLLERASDVISQKQVFVDKEELPLLQASIAIVSSKVLFQKGEYARARKLCLQVIEQVSVDEIDLQAEAYTRLGACAQFLGDYSLCIMYLQKALQLLGRNSAKRQTAELHSMLAYTYGLMGNFALADHHHTSATRCYNRLQDGWGKVNHLLNMGAIKHRQGDLISAEAIFQEALCIARGPIHFQRGEAYALVNLGGLYQDQRSYDKALAITDEGLALARQLKDKYLINCTLCTLAMTYLLMGDAETAMFFVTEANQGMSSQRTGGYERARCELVRGAILLHQHSYKDAYICLFELETYLRTIGLQWELLCTTLRLVECLLMQEQIPEALQRLEEVTALIQRNDYGQLVLRELHLLPALELAIKKMPELRKVSLLLQLEPGKKEVVPEEETENMRLAIVAPPSELLVTRKAQLKIHALGEPGLFIDEQPITRWRMGRAIELFFFLLASGRALRKEQILNALWTEVDDRVTQTLHSTIHYLRKSLGESCIISQTGTYRLDLTSVYGNDVWYDVEVFQTHYMHAKQALVDKDDKTAKIEFSTMAELYHGDYVQSFFSDWCTFQRDKLRQAYLDARQQLALIAWRNEQYDESVIHWQHILSVENYQEEAHYGIMRYYMRQGKRGLALRQYHRCVELLKNELAMEPGPRIQSLFQQLMTAFSTKKTLPP